MVQRGLPGRDALLAFWRVALLVRVSLPFLLFSLSIIPHTPPLYYMRECVRRPLGRGRCPGGVRGSAAAYINHQGLGTEAEYQPADFAEI